MEKKERLQIVKFLTDIILKNVDMAQVRSGQRSLFNEPEEMKAKIDLLDRTLEILRIETRHMKNDLKFEDFIQGSIRVDGKVLNYSGPIRQNDTGSGTKPIRLQAKLLLYLLYQHNQEDKQVYDIIDGFIKTIWNSLHILDFKKRKQVSCAVLLMPDLLQIPSAPMDYAFAIKEHVEERLAKKVSKDYLYDLLHRHKWRKVMPRPQHPKADKEKQEEFKKNFRSWWQPPKKTSARRITDQ